MSLSSLFPKTEEIDLFFASPNLSSHIIKDLEVSDLRYSFFKKNLHASFYQRERPNQQVLGLCTCNSHHTAKLICVSGTGNSHSFNGFLLFYFQFSHFLFIMYCFGMMP